MGTNDSMKTGEGFTSLKAGSKDTDAIEAYYDQWADTYDDTLKDWNYQAPKDAVDALSGCLKAGDRVLDVGCGTGLFGKTLSEKLDCRIEGVDISAASLKVAEEHGHYTRLQRHDLQVTPLPLDDGTFDAAACIGVMTYIEDAAALLADLCRIVRPGGHIYFTHRDDRWTEDDFDGILKDLEQRGLWTPVTVSPPKPYLPCNEEFADAIRVIHVLCRKN